MLAVDLHDLGPGLLKTASIPLPEKVATASLPERDELSRYPDSDFAVVMLGSEGKMRKFACPSPEVAWLNSQYLDAAWEGMPKTAAVVAAVSLLEKMEQGGYTSPALVAKVASHALNITASDGEYRVIEGLGGVVDIRKWEKTASTLAEMGGVGALGGGTVGAAAGLIKARRAGANKTETLKRTAGGAAVGMAGGILGSAAAGLIFASKYAEGRTKTASMSKTAALGERYPLDTEEQVKEAMAYFDEYGTSFHPADRREYCRNVLAQASAMDLDVTEKVAAYGGDQLNEAFVLHLNARASRVDERGGAILMKLAKIATAQGPDAFGKALTQFDEHYGLSQEWDRSLPDPYSAAFSKTAATTEDANYHWIKGIDKVTGADLLRLARQEIGQVHTAFGGDIAHAFQKSPVTIFKSLPYPQQVILARLAGSGKHARGTIH